MFKNKTDWLKKRIESENMDYKSFYDNTFVPVLKNLNLYKLYSKYFNSELDINTIEALDNFLNLLQSSKNNSSIAEAIKHNDEGIENEVLALYLFISQAFESFWEQNNIHYDSQIKNVFQHFISGFIITKFKQKVFYLSESLEKISNQDLFFLLNNFYSQIDLLLNSFNKLIHNYIKIDSYSFVMNELVIQSIDIDYSDSDSDFVSKVYPKIVEDFIKTGFYNSNDFIEVKRSIKRIENTRKTKNKKYWDDLGKEERKLESMIMQKINELNMKAIFTNQQENFDTELIEKEFTKYPRLFDLLKSGEIDEIRNNAYYSEEVLLKRYTTAANGIEDVIIRFNNK